MADNPLKSLASYSRFVAELLDRSTVLRSTVVGLFAMLFLAFFLEYVQRHRSELES